ncbi:MAG: AAA family ATPase [Paludibacteraceae bacterium]|nr:AAA family ATPase [Paludibacteraceae bacterium]
MGLYLNPNAESLKQSLRNKIYIDKSLVIAELNDLAETDLDFVCISRPRRFGKSMVGNLISAYYSKGCDTRSIFSQMKIGQTPDYDKYLNKLNVIKLVLVMLRFYLKKRI